MILKESTWVEVGEELGKTRLAIVPIGATECHGLHNPLGTEILIVEELAIRLNDRIDAIVTPTIPVSYSRAWSEFPGTLWVKPATLKAYLKDICDCLVERGIRRIFFINGHGPNIPVIEEISQELAPQGVISAQIDLWRFVGKVSSDLGESEVPLGHSGELATSVMMALNGELVRIDKLRPTQEVDTLSTAFPDIIQYHTRGITIPLGFAGDPTKATREKGEIILDRCLDRLEKFLTRWVAE